MDSNLQNNQPEKQQEEQPQKPKRRWLSGLFNVATGAAVAIGIKTACTIGLACTAAPALAVTLGAAAATGAIMGAWAMHKDYKEQKAANDEKAKLRWSKMITRIALTTVGAGIIEAFGDEISDGLCKLFDKCTVPVIPEPDLGDYPEIPKCLDDDSCDYYESDPLPNEPLTPETPSTEYSDDFDFEPCDAQGTCDSTLDTNPTAIEEPEAGEPETEDIPDVYTPSETMLAAAEILQNGPDTPQSLLDRLEDAMNGDAQAQKDVADHIFNDCNPTADERHTAALLAHEASEAGNMQAKEFYNFIRYWGMAGIESAKDEAIAAMREVDTDSARHLVAQWTGEVPMEQIDPVSNCDETVAAITETPTETPVADADTPQADTPETSGLTEKFGDHNGCTAIINIEEGISFVCDIPYNMDVQVGDAIQMENPPVDFKMLLKDDASAILGIPRP